MKSTLTPMSFQQLQYAFSRRIRDPENAPALPGIEPRRMKVYEDLFFNNLSSLLAGTFPVLHAILGRVRWNALIRDFMQRHRAHTPLFPEVPQELLKFLETTRANYDVVRFRRLVKLAEDNYVQHKYVETQIQSRARAGVARGVDLEQAVARLALADSNLTTERANLVPIFTDRANFVRSTGIKGTDQFYAVVVNRRGDVLARIEGEFSEYKAQVLRETLQAQDL